MLNMHNVPSKGKLYAVFSDKGIFFEDYNIDQNLDKIKKIAEDEFLLELHLFNDKFEYRYIKTRGRGDIENIVSNSKMINDYNWDKEELDQHIYEEKYICVYEQDGSSKNVNVVNYIDYDEDDLLHIVNYRLVEV